MSSETSTVTTTGTMDLPDDLLDGFVAVTIQGAAGSGSGVLGAAAVVGLIPASAFPILVVIGETPTGSDGGAGFSGGGGGGGGGQGGGSSAIVSQALSTFAKLLIEAGGSSGPPITTLGVTGGGGGAGGYSGDAGGTPSVGGTGGGGGGSKGGFGGGTSLGNVGGTGVGSPSSTFGLPGLPGSGGAGGQGDGVLVSLHTGTCFADASIGDPTFSQIGSAATGQAVFNWTQADPPDVPTLVTPLSGDGVDVEIAGVTFVGTYETSGDTGPLAALSLGLTIDGGSTVYFNGRDFTSTVPVWLIPTTGGGAVNGENFSLVVPPGVLTNGHAYTWTLATQEAFVGLQGTAATAQGFSGTAAPSATFTAPTSAPNTLTPTVSWNMVGLSQTAYRFLLYDAPNLVPGSGVPLYDSGTVVDGTSSFTLPSLGLLSGTPYYGYLLVTGTDNNVANAWVPIVFTPTLAGGDQPTLAASSSNEPTTGMPAALLDLTYTDTGFDTAAEFQVSFDGTNWQDIPFGPYPGSSTETIAYDMGSPFNAEIQYRGRTVYEDSGQLFFSDYSDGIAFGEVESTYWWIVPPTALESSMQLMRLPSSGTSTGAVQATPTTPAMPGTLVASIEIEEWEQMGVFRPFGKSTAMIVHGDLWEGEFDLDLYFDSPTSWEAFRAIRELQGPVLLKSDMEGAIYWVTLGPDLTPGIASRTERQSNPTRGLTVHCTPTDPPS